MSGPKSSDWSVAENLRLLALARAAAFAEADACEAELAEALREAEAIRAKVGAAAQAVLRKPDRPAENATVSEIDGYIAVLRQLTQRAAEQAHAAASLGRLHDIVANAARAHQLAQQRLSEQTRQKAEDERRQRAERLGRILSRAPADPGQTDQARLETLSAEWLACEDAGRGKGLEMELRAVVQTLQARDAARKADADRARQLRTMLRGLGGPKIEGVLAEISAVESGRRGLDPGLAARAERAAEEGRWQADRAYAAEVLRSEFLALGYTVGDDFQTAFSGGGEVMLERPERSPYGVKIAIDAVADNLVAEVVRVAADEVSSVERRRRDREAEEAWCSDFAAILSAASRHHVRARVVKREPPGAQPVAVVGVRRGEQARRREGPKARSMGTGGGE